jgi:hypothetical protein
MIHQDGDYAICTKVSEGSEHQFDNAHFGANYVHSLSGKPVEVYPRYERKQEVDEHCYDPARLHEEYVEIKKRYRLSIEDEEYLTDQGIMNTSRYFTLPEPADKDVMGFRKGGNKKGVPGFFRRGDDYYLNLNYWGMAAACVNEDNQIVGIEIRLSDACKQFHAERMIAKGQEPGKFLLEKSVYRPLTSPWGSKIKSWQKLSVWKSKKSNTIWITEGLKKGQILHEQTKDNVIAIIGVGNWMEAYKTAIKMRHNSSKITRVVVAFDMDRLTNPAVKSAHEKLVEYFVETGTLAVCEAQWDEAYKGVDDLLNNGMIPKVIPLDNRVYEGIDEARANLQKQFSELLRNPNGKLNVFQVSAGVGKTYAIIDAINKLNDSGWPMVETARGNKRPMRICMLTDTKELAYESQALFNFYPPVLEGRSNDENSLFFCAEKKKIDMIARAGQNTRKYGCSNCAFQQECKDEFYLGSVEMILQQNFVLATKAAIINRSSRIDDFDIIIMDEGIRQSLQDEMVVNSLDIELFIKSLRKSKYYHNERTKEMALIDHDNPKYKRTQKAIKKDEDSIDVIDEQIENCQRLVELLDSGEQVGDDFRLNFKFSAGYRFSEYVRVDKNDNRWDGIEDGDKKMVFVPPIFYGHEKAVWRTTDNRIMVKSVNMKALEKLKEKTVINLDATPIEEYCKLFPDYELHQTSVKEHVVIKTIRDRKYAKTQLIKNPEYLDELIDVTKELTQKHESVGVLTTKFIAEYLIEAGVPQSMVGWYGKDTRGSNRMKNVDALIMPGPYIENLNAIDRDVTVLNMAGVQTDRDTLVTQITSAETIQAVARGRAVQRSADNPLIVYKLTNQKIAGIKEGEIFSNIHDLLASFDKERSKRMKQARKEWKMLLLKKPDRSSVDESASNPMIAENEPLCITSYKYNEIVSETGVHFLKIGLLPEFQNPALFESLLNCAQRLKNISGKIWKQFLECVKLGESSVKELSDRLSCSESTVKRLRKALVCVLFPEMTKDSTEAKQAQLDAVDSAIRTKVITQVVEKCREVIPDDQIDAYYAENSKLVESDEATAFVDWHHAEIKTCEPADLEENIFFFWTSALRAYPSAYAVMTKHFPEIVIDSVLKNKGESDHEIIHVSGTSSDGISG